MTHPTSQNRVCLHCGEQSAHLDRVTPRLESYRCWGCEAYTLLSEPPGREAGAEGAVPSEPTPVMQLDSTYG